MRIHMLLLVSASLVTACTDAPAPTSDVGTHPALTAIAAGLRPTTVQVGQPQAIERCGLTTHLPTAVSVQQALGDCVATSRGWLCAPLSVHASETSFGDLELAQVWTSTPCEASGFFVASFDTGEIRCVEASQTAAQTLCVR